jgi:chromosome segregation ATPase
MLNRTERLSVQKHLASKTEKIILIMSNLNGLLNEAEKANERLKQAIVSGDYDLMTKIERSKSELNSRIFFARRDELAERLNDLRIEKQSALELQTELAAELTAQAAVVMKAKSELYDKEAEYAAITAKQYYVQNQIELNRTESNRIGSLLNTHIQSRLNGVSGSNGATRIDLMENDICELLPN